MKHLEPSEQSKPRSETGPAGASRSSGWKLLTAALALAIGVGYGMTAAWNPTPKDSISDAEETELINAYSKLESVQVEQVADQEAQAALDSMRLAPGQRQAFKKVLAGAGPVSTPGNVGTQSDTPALVWVVLWDFAAADGDVVSVSTAGYTVEVPLQNTQTRIAVPVDATRIVRITGARDGGGGITLGVQSGTSVVSLPVLQVGQELSIPVSF